MRFFRLVPVLGAARHGFAASLLVVLGLIPTSAFAEYNLRSGDTLQISVIGVPGFNERSLIGVEGKISLPLVGQIEVSGLSLAAASAKIASDVSNKIYRQSGSDGREVPYLIVPEDVVVSVVEYRPIYVSGDVAKPGEYTFRPGITVRQAVAVAGGYGLTRFGVTNPSLEGADLRSESAALWTEFAREQAHAWRLRSELGEQDGKPSGDKLPIPASVSDRFVKAENEQLQARIADRQKEKAFLQVAIAKANLQLSTLAEKKKAVEGGNQADVSDFEKVTELYRRGLATMMRLSESRRVALLSSDQLLQMVVDMSNIERQRGEYTWQLEKVDGQTRVDDLKELQSVNLRLAQITAHLKSTDEKMAYMGLMKSQLMPGTAGQPVVTVHRKGDKDPQHLISVDEDLELAPGDVVDVALRNDRVAKLLTTPSKDVIAAAQ